MKTLKDILQLRKNFNKQEKEQIKRAYHFAKKAHKGQKYNGTTYPYFIHPAYAGWLLAKWKQDHELICAGLLHDVIEDCEVSLDTIRKLFGERVAFLVDGMSWERKWNTKKKRYLKDWEGFHRKIADYTFQDFTVAIVHAADELSKLEDVLRKRIEKRDENPEKKRKRNARMTRFMIPFYEEIGLTKVAEKLHEKIKDNVKKENSELKRYITQKELNSIKSKINETKGIEELK